MTNVHNLGFTGNADIDGLLYFDISGTYGTPGVAVPIASEWDTHSLTYSDSGAPSDIDNNFSGYLVNYNPANYSALASSRQIWLEAAAAQIPEFANLTLTKITETSTTHADLRAEEAAQTFSEATAPTTLGSGYATGGTAIGESGLMTFKNNTGLMNLTGNLTGTYEAYTFMHELGHAIGLNHPFISQNLITSGHQGIDYTVMAYADYPGDDPTSYLQTADGNFVQSYMTLDIQALQYLYGANYGSTANNGTTVYTFSTTTGEESINSVAQGTPYDNHILRTIWDGGGNDTYDFSNYTTNLTVDLRPGYWTSLGTQLATLGDSTSTLGAQAAPGNIDNALVDPNNPTETASLIENAIGGSGNDSITGNAADNVLTGGGGNDTLYGQGGYDLAAYSGARGNYTVSVTTANVWWSIADTRGGSPDGTDAVQIADIEGFKFSDGVYSDAHVIAGDAHANAIMADFSATHDSWTSLSTALVSIDGNASVTMYDVWNTTSGSMKIAGTVQDYGSDNYVSAANLSTVQFGAGDTFYIRAFDGSAWGAWDTIVSTATANTAPSTSAVSGSVTGTVHLSYSGLFTSSDTDSDTITTYQIENTGSHGHIVVNGISQANSTWINVTADQLVHHTTFDSDTTYTGSETLWERSNDGFSWSSWASTTVNETAVSTSGNHAPVVSTSLGGSGPHGDISMNVSAFVSDADSDTIQTYRFWDYGTNSGANGHLELNGKVMAVATNIDVSASELNNLHFVGGTGTDNLSLQAFDGKQWGSWQNFSYTQPTDNDPTVSGSATHSMSANTSVAMSTLFTASDADGDTLTYHFWDGSAAGGSGHFAVNGVNQHSGSDIVVLAADLANTAWISALSAGTEHTWVAVSDGTHQSAWHALDIIV